MSAVKEVSITIKFTTGVLADTSKGDIEQRTAGLLCGLLAKHGIIEDNPRPGSGLFEIEIIKYESEEV